MEIRSEPEFATGRSLQATNGHAPDLMVLFSATGLAIGGYGRKTAQFNFENDTGPDDANHGQYGIFIVRSPAPKFGRKLEGLEIQELHPRS